jgi:hypothetical protein
MVRMRRICWARPALCSARRPLCCPGCKPRPTRLPVVALQRVVAGDVLHLDHAGSRPSRRRTGRRCLGVRCCRGFHALTSLVNDAKERRRHGDLKAESAGKFGSFSPAPHDGERGGAPRVRHRYRVAARAKRAIRALDAAALRVAGVRCRSEDRSLQRHVVLSDEHAGDRGAALQRAIPRAASPRRHGASPRAPQQIEARLRVERVSKEKRLLEFAGGARGQHRPAPDQAGLFTTSFCRSSVKAPWFTVSTVPKFSTNLATCAVK